MFRTQTCGELTAQNANQEVTLSGWANKIRNLGGLTFVDLRDRYGITQIVCDPDKIDIPEIKPEYVLQITGKVNKRPDDMINKDMKTGEIEIHPTEIKILSVCAELPFSVDHENPVGEEIRLEHRYLDLRRDRMKNNTIMRHKLYMETLNFFDKEGFINIETPCFTKNTPEGSREYVVPARFDPGKFFVLPQAPQQYKQMLMVAGYDKYVQMARCFRDEDPRGDRQPEFTQVDFEMSFAEQEDILGIIEQYYINITEKYYPNKKIIENPFPRITWQDAMNNYGSDKPEYRTKELSLIDVSDWAKKTELSLFNKSECTKCILAPREYSRGEIEKKFESVIKESGGKGLAYIIFTAEGPKGGILKFFTDEQIEELKKITGAKEGNTLLFQTGEWLDTVELLGALRTKLIDELEILKGKENELDYTFVVDFPMFELSNDGRLGSAHHPFTKPKDEHIPYILALAEKMRTGYELVDQDKKALLAIKADCFDIVVNNVELGGGSIRIHDQKLQHAVFTVLGISEEQIQLRFGHILKCFSFGVPPHGGCAFGFDRTVMVLQNEPNIREVITFPKNQKYRDPMFHSPSDIDPGLLDELGLKLKENLD